MDPLQLMSTASTGLGLIGGLFSGIGSFNAGNNKAKALFYASQQAEQEAGVNAQNALEQGDEVAAHGAVQAAANGGGFTGSSLGVISQLGQRALFSARAAAYRGNTEAQNDQYEAKVAKANGVNSLIGSAVGGIGGAISGWAKSAFQSQYLNALGGRLGDVAPAQAGFDPFSWEDN